jgi:peptidoglycan/LPS O-acetylase OafA/YrhL
MVRGSLHLSEDALMAFTTIVALVAIAVAFVAYVGTWIHAWIAERRREAKRSGLADVRLEDAGAYEHELRA